jgi:response regulator RpfG family c-di-GMP phosphodiesterase
MSIGGITVHQSEILLVDDDPNILKSYGRTLRGKFKFDTAESGIEALEKIKNNKNYAVVVSDMQMPNMNGIELLKKIKQTSPNIVRIMLTGNSDQKTAIDAINVGDIFRFINKPCSAEILIKSINSSLQQYDLIAAKNILLNQTLRGVINVLNEVLSLVSPDVMEKNNKILTYMNKLKKTLKLKDNWSFEPMIQLSQLGCIIFPESTLKNIESGKLISGEEKQLFDQHPCLSSDLIRKIPKLENIAQNILYQDKCFNGEGVPHDNIKGEEIPYGARMLKVVLDYIHFETREGSSLSALLKMQGQKQFYDPKILLAFKLALDVTEPDKKLMIDISQLKKGMIINENIITHSKQLVARSGQKVTDSLLQILSHCLVNEAVSGTIHVSLGSLNE